MNAELGGELSDSRGLRKEFLHESSIMLQAHSFVEEPAHA